MRGSGALFPWPKNGIRSRRLPTPYPLPKRGAGLSSEEARTLGVFCDALMDSGAVAAFPCGQPRETRIGTHIGSGRRSTDVPIEFGSHRMPQTQKNEAKSKGAAGVAPRVFSFSLTLHGASELIPEIADALYEAGCDDALVGSRDGVLFAEFDREAPSSAAAIISAIRQIESAGAGLTVVRVEPDELVSAAEIADRVGLNRETIRLYALGRRGPGAFPPPVARVRGRSPLYRWTDVAPWLAHHGGTAAAAAFAELETATLIGVLNAAFDLRRLVPRATEHASLRHAFDEIDLRITDREGQLLAIECKLRAPESTASVPKRPRRTRQ